MRWSELLEKIGRKLAINDIHHIESIKDPTGAQITEVEDLVDGDVLAIKMNMNRLVHQSGWAEISDPVPIPSQEELDPQPQAGLPMAPAIQPQQPLQQPQESFKMVESTLTPVWSSEGRVLGMVESAAPVYDKMQRGRVDATGFVDIMYSGDQLAQAKAEAEEPAPWLPTSTSGSAFASPPQRPKQPRRQNDPSPSLRGARSTSSPHESHIMGPPTSQNWTTGLAVPDTSSPEVSPIKMKGKKKKKIDPSPSQAEERLQSSPYKAERTNSAKSLGSARSARSSKVTSSHFFTSRECTQ